MLAYPLCFQNPAEKPSAASQERRIPKLVISKKLLRQEFRSPSPNKPLRAAPCSIPQRTSSPMNFTSSATIPNILQGSLVQGGYVSPISRMIRTPTPRYPNYSPNAHLRSAYVSYIMKILNYNINNLIGN